MADRLTDEQIAEIRSKHEAKTPSPFFAMDYLAHRRSDMSILLDELDAIKSELAALRQVSAELCADCGWAMKFPGEPCRNCECARLEKETTNAPR